MYLVCVWFMGKNKFVINLIGISNSLQANFPRSVGTLVVTMPMFINYRSQLLFPKS